MRVEDNRSRHGCRWSMKRKLHVEISLDIAKAVRVSLVTGGQPRVFLLPGHFPGLENE